MCTERAAIKYTYIEHMPCLLIFSPRLFINVHYTVEIIYDNRIVFLLIFICSKWRGQVSEKY